jgi:hypothetical protein
MRFGAGGRAAALEGRRHRYRACQISTLLMCKSGKPDLQCRSSFEARALPADRVIKPAIAGTSQDDGLRRQVSQP